MLVTIDKRGSISVPVAVRKELGLHAGSCLDLTILDGGGLALTPITIYPTIRLSDGGLAKLKEARESGVDRMPDWLLEEMNHASPDSN